MRWCIPARGLRCGFGRGCLWFHGRRRRRNCSAEYGHEILAHLAHVADALGDAEAVEALEDFDCQAAPDAAAVAKLRGGEAGRRALRDDLRDGGKLRERRLRIKTLGRHTDNFTGARLAMQKILE